MPPYYAAQKEKFLSCQVNRLEAASITVAKYCISYTYFASRAAARDIIPLTRQFKQGHARFISKRRDFNYTLEGFPRCFRALFRLQSSLEISIYYQNSQISIECKTALELKRSQLFCNKNRYLRLKKTWVNWFFRKNHDPGLGLENFIRRRRVGQAPFSQKIESSDK